MKSTSFDTAFARGTDYFLESVGYLLSVWMLMHRYPLVLVIALPALLVVWRGWPTRVTPAVCTGAIVGVLAYIASVGQTTSAPVYTDELRILGAIKGAIYGFAFWFIESRFPR